MDPFDWIDDALAELDRQCLRRRLTTNTTSMGPVLEIDGRPVINYASNDYLGIASDKRLAAAAALACQEDGVGRGASPLICGRSTWHDKLEKRLAEFEGCESVLLFPSGYAANSGVIPALVSHGDIVFSDAKNHASIVDGCRLSRADVVVYPHADCDVLEARLRHAKNVRRRLIVSDTLFSMDGDLAPLTRLAELAERYDAMLMVDEAHATGVFGPSGRGVIEHLDAEHPELCLHDRVQVRVGTLSKALGSAGGFVAGQGKLIDWLSNRSRSYVFSTAHPSAASAAAVAALDIVQNEPDRRINVLNAAADLREKLRSQGWAVGCSSSQVIPLHIGAPDLAQQLALNLREKGIWVPAIRPPSVPVGSSLLRISVSAAHTPKMHERLTTELSCARDLIGPIS